MGLVTYCIHDEGHTALGRGDSAEQDDLYTHLQPEMAFDLARLLCREACLGPVSRKNGGIASCPKGVRVREGLDPGNAGNLLSPGNFHGPSITAGARNFAFRPLAGPTAGDVRGEPLPGRPGAARRSRSVLCAESGQARCPSDPGRCGDAGAGNVRAHTAGVSSVSA